ncbi:MAG: prolyl oligopeptidase family serine peptidase [Minicystis sp.]
MCALLIGACRPSAPRVDPRASPAVAPAIAGGQISYPPARKGDVVETRHGETVADPYRWLEDLGSAETRAWVAAENAVTRRWIDGVPSRERIARELAAIRDFERISTPKKRGGRWFFSRNSGRQDQPVLVVADTLASEPRAIVDFNRISPDGKLGLAGSSVSPRGTYVAYGLSAGGSDWVEWRVREVATGRDLPDRIEWTKYYWPTWSADEKSLYYSRFPRPDPGQELNAQDLGCTVRLHQLGTDASADPVIHERRDHPTYQFEPRVTEDGRWLVITTGDGQVGDRGVEEIHAVDLAAGAPRPRALPLVTGFDAEYLYAGNEGSTFFLKTTNGAPKGRVIGVDVRAPARDAWTTIVPAGDAAIQDVVRSGGRLLVTTLVDASSRLRAVSLDGREAVEIPLPGIGTAWPSPMPRDEQAVFYSYSSFDTPPTTFRHDLVTGRSEPIHPPKTVLDPSTFESHLVSYPSRDGVRIPMFVVHRKGLVLDGTNPTYLTGYGASAAASSPYFSPAEAWWLAAGGVLAEAVIRGGPEYGEAWQKAAEKTHRQIAFDDFIAAAEHLIAARYTSPAKLAIAGASNGGLLVAAAATQRPDLFGAVVVKVGVLDMLRFHLAGQGAGWQGVYGSPDVAEEFRALRAYSPVHNVKPGTRYPSMLVVTGDHETRVAPWHSFKFVAALQAAQRGPAPVLLYLEADAGHFGATTLTAGVTNEAEVLAFVRNALNAPLR